MDAFVIRLDALALDEHVQPAIAIPRPSRRMKLQSCEQVAVVDAAMSLITPGGSAEPDNATRPP
jgi:hypothetical protein